MKESEDPHDVEDVDMDSTQALLDSTIPDTPDIIDSVMQDSDEEEIFFGNTSNKEKGGKNSKFNRRETICLSDGSRRRSFDVTNKTKSRDFLLSQHVVTGRKSSSRSSLYSTENSIIEEEDENDSVFTEELMIGAERFEEANYNHLEQKQFNVTGRKYRKGKQRNQLKSLVSLPSVTTVKDTMEGVSIEGERMEIIDRLGEMKEERDLLKRRSCDNNNDPRPCSDPSSVSSCDTDRTDEDWGQQVDKIDNEVEDSQLAAEEPELEMSYEDNRAGEFDGSSKYVEDVQPELEMSYEDNRAGEFDGSSKYVEDVINTSNAFDESAAKSNDTSDGSVNTSGEVSKIEVNQFGCVARESLYEVSGIEPLSLTDECLDITKENTNADLSECVHERTANCETSTITSTVNSGVITFKEDAIVSGVYGSFSDETRDELVDETEVQEEGDISDNNVCKMVEDNSCEVTSDVFDDSLNDKVESVKRQIFYGESDMESFVLGSVDSELDIDTQNPHSSFLSIIEDPNIVIDSVKSDLGSVEVGNLGREVSELSLGAGEDSVFCSDSLGGHQDTLSHSFDIPEDEFESDIDDVDENLRNQNEMVDNDDVDETFHDQSEEQIEEVNIIPQIVLTRPSLTNNICDDDESSIPKFLPVSPNLSTRCIYQTAPTSVNTSMLSPSFDTTADEMMLFEMFGEEYDKIVDDMSKQQKVDLKEKLNNRGEEEISKVAEKLHKLMHDKSREFSIGSTVSPFSLAASTPSFHLPLDLSPQLTIEHEARSPQPLHNTGKYSSGSPQFRVPTSPQPAVVRYLAQATYSLPTTSSLGKMVTISPSPKKNKAIPWLPPSPSPKCPLSLSPSRPQSLRPIVSRIPQPVYTSLTPQRALQTMTTTPQRVLHRLATPNSSKKSGRVAGLRATEYAAVASPVGEYVKNNPAPPLVQNVKAKSSQRDLESTLVEVDNKENLLVSVSNVPFFCPLPAANYKSGTVSKEKLVDVTGPEYAYIPEAYGAVSTSARVTKHVARVRVEGQAAMGDRLKWNEICLANDESLNSSPSIAKFKAPVKSVLKQTRRDSGLFDESLLEMSVHETKVIKKMARGRGKGRGKK